MISARIQIESKTRLWYTHHTGESVPVYFEKPQRLESVNAYLQVEGFDLGRRIWRTFSRTSVKASRGGRLSPFGNSTDTTMTDPSAPSRFLPSSSIANIALGDAGLKSNALARLAYAASKTDHGSTSASTNENNVRGLDEAVRRRVRMRK
jgi:hypothetical protein